MPEKPLDYRGWELYALYRGVKLPETPRLRLISAFNELEREYTHLLLGVPNVLQD